MQGRGYGWLGEPLLHLILIVAALACLGVWRSASRVPEVGTELQLVGDSPVASAAPDAPADAPDV